MKRAAAVGTPSYSAYSIRNVNKGRARQICEMKAAGKRGLFGPGRIVAVCYVAWGLLALGAFTGKITGNEDMNYGRPDAPLNGKSAHAYSGRQGHR